jgi:hypothetical protein
MIEEARGLMPPELLVHSMGCLQEVVMTTKALLEFHLVLIIGKFSVMMFHSDGPSLGTALPFY